MTQRKGDTGLDFEALRLAIERCDPDLVLAFYAEDAQLTIVNTGARRGFQFGLRGKAEIAKHLRAVFGQGVSHRVDNQGLVGKEDGVKFREACEYPDGSRIVIETTLEVRSGKIVRQVDVVARDVREDSEGDRPRANYPKGSPANPPGVGGPPPDRRPGLMKATKKEAL